jgi:hypothetical protein
MKRKSPIFRKRKQRKSALRLRVSKRVSKWIRAAHRRTVMIDLATSWEFHCMFTRLLSRRIDEAVSEGAVNPSVRDSVLPRRLYARPFGLQSRRLQERDRFLT